MVKLKMLVCLGGTSVETLCLLLQDELDLKRSRSTERRYKQSGLDERLTLADFDWRFNPKVPRLSLIHISEPTRPY